MATGFTRTLRSLEGESSMRFVLVAVLVAVLLGGWVAWSFLAELSVYETTTSARLETDSATTPIQSAAPGRVVESWLTVGREVSVGDLLLQLDTSRYALELAEKRTAASALEREIAGLRSQVLAEARAQEEEHRAMLASQEEARAGAREAQAPARYNVFEEERLRRLREGGLISERDYQRGVAETQRSQAAVERETAVLTRLEREQTARNSDRHTRVRRLETEIARLEGEIAKNSAAGEVLQNEMSRLSVRSPISGRIGEAATIRPGSVIAEGDRLGAIVPAGQIQVVAQFSPGALGRITPGQQAAMRLEGFSWTKYGALHAIVTRVAGEVRDGSIRVELALADSRSAQTPLTHGLPGTLEVEIERATPAALVLRSIGRMIARPTPAYEAGEGR